VNRISETVLHPYTDSAGLLEDGARLRDRLDEEGYLFLRGILPRPVIAEVRTELLEILSDAGWIRREKPAADAIADLSNFVAEPDPAFLEIFYRELSLKSVNALAHRPELVTLFERLFEDDVLVHPRIIMRNLFPQQAAYTTPAHQDHPLVQGPRDHYAAWIPLGDCPVEMGGYSLAPRTHKSGYFRFEPALGIGQMEIVDLPDQWVYSPTRMGDVVVHHSMLVHRGVVNRSDSIRLSMDCRYQRLSDPVVDRALMPSMQQTTWEALYRGWDDDEFKYYWKKLDLEVQPFDLTPFDERDKRAIELGFQGNNKARSALVGVVHRHRDPTMRARATRALARLDALNQSTT